MCSGVECDTAVARRIPEHLVEELEAPGLVENAVPSAHHRFFGHSVSESKTWSEIVLAWENSPRRHHQRTVHIDSYWIDKYPITNAEFKKFLNSTHYRPKTI